MTITIWGKTRYIPSVSLFLFCLFGALFAGITDEITGEKLLLSLDQSTSNWMAINQGHYQRTIFLITHLGESHILTIVTLLISVGLWFSRRRTEGVLFCIGFAITGASIAITKFLTDRIPPTGAYPLQTSLGAFPSGHAALSLFFFGFLAYLLSQGIKRKFYSSLVFSTGLLIAIIIGASRIYLNVHWLSDVLGGFALAAAFLSFCIGFLEIHIQKKVKTKAPNSIATAPETCIQR